MIQNKQGQFNRADYNITRTFLIELSLGIVKTSYHIKELIKKEGGVLGA